MFNLTASWRAVVRDALLSITLASGICSAQSPPKPTVTIPVFVTNRQGEPVLGLTEKDFSVESAGKSEPIVTAKAIKAVSTGLRRYPQSELKAANTFNTDDSSPRHIFLLFVDEPHLEMKGPELADLRREVISALGNA